MIFRVLTIFPDFFQGPLQHGVVAKAAESGLIQIHIHDLRTWTHDRHRTVDDRPFGGGEGMLLKPAPIFEAVESIWPDRAQSQPAPDPAFRPRPALRSGSGTPLKSIPGDLSHLRPIRRRRRTRGR